MVNISLRVLARPDATNLPHIYRMLGTDYDERVLPSICNEVRTLLFYYIKLLEKLNIFKKIKLILKAHKGI